MSGGASPPAPISRGGGVPVGDDHFFARQPSYSLTGLQRRFLELLCGRVPRLPIDDIEHHEWGGLCHTGGGLQPCRDAKVRI